MTNSKSRKSADANVLWHHLITHPGLQQRSCQKIGPPRHQLPLKVPPINTATARISRPCHNVCARVCLLLDHVWNVLRLRAAAKASVSATQGKS